MVGLIEAGAGEIHTFGGAAFAQCLDAGRGRRPSVPACRRARGTALPPVAAAPDTVYINYDCGCYCYYWSCGTRSRSKADCISTLRYGSDTGLDRGSPRARYVLPNMADKDKMAKYRTEIQQVSCCCALFLIASLFACSILAVYFLFVGFSLFGLCWPISSRFLHPAPMLHWHIK
jgi:hypothetical protein